VNGWLVTPGRYRRAAMYTTITVNGHAGARFLSSLGGDGARLPPALALLLEQRADSIEVATFLAEQAAEFVARVRADRPGDDGDSADPPLLFSPSLGDPVTIVRDVLVEFHVPFSDSPHSRVPRIWRYVPRGTRGRLIAHGEVNRVMLEPSREIAYVRPRSMTCVRFLPAR
jgi:hypothetical protein